MATTVNRIDGRLKVTGAAQYAAEFQLAGTAHGVFAGSSIASGAIRSINTSAARQAPGVLLVLTHDDSEPLGKMPNALLEGGQHSETRPPLEDGRIFYAGQYIGFIVAESLEQAKGLGHK
jgi:xanthine dehydrogenase YagR molybdenum-binding subunit